MPKNCELDTLEVKGRQNTQTTMNSQKRAGMARVGRRATTIKYDAAMFGTLDSLEERTVIHVIQLFWTK